jgi:DNA-binding transcriptional LysR family regulator
VRVRVEGQLAFNTVAMIVRAAEDGLGLGFVMEDQVARQLADGRLVRVLDDWCPAFAGYHLYYPSRRQPTPAFSILVESLRYRG